MKVNNQSYQSIWFDQQEEDIKIIDQTLLPHQFIIKSLSCLRDAELAIKDMLVRGAPLIGVTAAWGIWLAMRDDNSDDALKFAINTLEATRPTAVNLHWALDKMWHKLSSLPTEMRLKSAFNTAVEVMQADINTCEQIGINGLAIIEKMYLKENRAINILTHCNAGWLAAVDWGTALAPIYKAYDKQIPIHVWVDETRPRNQGASLTAFELGAHGIPHTVIADNVGGHLMQHQQVDLCIVGSDRCTKSGDICNKIGTYLKALAAYDNQIPFYAALPFSTIDWKVSNGITEIPIEQRCSDEVTHISGLNQQGQIESVRLVPDNTQVANYAFDVTPARLVTSIITERGVCDASEAGLTKLYSENKQEKVSEYAE